MKPENIEAAQKARKRDALWSAALHILTQGLAALFLLWLGTRTERGWLNGLFLLLAALSLVGIPPIFVVLKQRFKEIEGGELDAAGKY